MDLPTPSARALRSTDAELLREFRCSTGPWFENEVEEFIQRRLLPRHEHRREHVDHRAVLLELPDLGIVAVCAHEEDFVRYDGEDRTGSYLEVTAVALDVQGARLPDVEPFEDSDAPPSVGRYLGEVLLADIAGRNRDPYLRGVVARDNERSLRLCTRLGLVDERDDDDERFVQRLGLMER